MNREELLSERASDAEPYAYPKPLHGWTCFHCGETFTTSGSARDHFGFEPSADPACIIKLGAERGLVMALRRAEKDCEEMRRAVADESTDSATAYYAQNTRHREQLMSVEEAGYERGLADGRAEVSQFLTERDETVARAERAEAAVLTAVRAMESARIRMALFAKGGVGITLGASPKFAEQELRQAIANVQATLSCSRDPHPTEHRSSSVPGND